jgi:hypothetical protein
LLWFSSSWSIDGAAPRLLGKQTTFGSWRRPCLGFVERNQSKKTSHGKSNFRLGEVINSAQTPEQLCEQNYSGNYKMQQHWPIRQMPRYFGVIVVILIVAAALCWGLAHI